MVETAGTTVVSSLAELPDGYFQDNPSIERRRFKDIDFVAQRFENSRIRSCEFIKCGFADCIFADIDLQRTSFKNCRFENCLLSTGLRFITGSVHDTSFYNVDFSSSLIQNVSWHGCHLDGVEFRRVKAKSIDFSHSSFSKVGFDGSHLVRGDFRDIPGLSRAMFYSAKLEDCSFDWSESFVVMEFGNPRADELYRYGIEPLLRESGYEPRRVDRYEFHGRITDEILQSIVTCQIVVAECSATNKNVYFEVGYALGNQRDVIFLIDEAENIPFDLKDFKFIIHHNSIDSLREQLRRRLEFFVQARTTSNLGAAPDGWHRR